VEVVWRVPTKGTERKSARRIVSIHRWGLIASGCPETITYDPCEAAPLSEDVTG
jgi:hypothetical protein